MLAPMELTKSKLDNGADVYKCLCPYNHTKTEAFTFSIEKQLFKCFDCGRGGSINDMQNKLNDCKAHNYPNNDSMFIIKTANEWMAQSAQKRQNEEFLNEIQPIEIKIKMAE